MSVSLLAVTFGVATMMFQTASGVSEAHGARVQTVQTLNRALSRMAADLRFSGAVTVGGATFPALIEDGNATGSLGTHAHPAPNPSDGGGVTAREVVFLHHQSSCLLYTSPSPRDRG